MFREPIGNNKVGLIEKDTIEFGDGDFRRKLSLLFFFPTEEEGEEYPYKDEIYQREKLTGIPHDNKVKTNCCINVRLSDELKKYPVIIYSHGLMGHQMESTVLCTDLASSGYIVISIGHPYGSSAVTYTDGTMFEPQSSYVPDRHNLAPLGRLWLEDTEFAVSYIRKINETDTESMFYNRMDLTKGVSLLGMSFGGCVSVCSALEESDVLCAINLDGSLFIDPNPKYKEKPILVLCSPFNIKAYAKLQRLQCENVTVHKIRKLSHWEFCDGIYFTERGKKDTNRADTISINRAKMCMEFIEEASSDAHDSFDNTAEISEDDIVRAVNRNEEV